MINLYATLFMMVLMLILMLSRYRTKHLGKAEARGYSMVYSPWLLTAVLIILSTVALLEYALGDYYADSMSDSFRIFIVWYAGSLIYIVRAYYQHRCFQKEIMKDAERVSCSTEEEQSYGILRNEIETLILNSDLSASAFKDITLYRSKAVHTPLALGFRRASSKIILPYRDYTEKELTWIFRHELMHIINGDPLNKFYMTICKASLWFLPMAWKTTEAAFEDLELSCDEKVLYGQDEETRRFYAKLILSTAGESRGFTSCLSAKGSSMRYRLKHILESRKEHMATNILLIMILTAMITFSYGQLALSMNSLSIYLSMN